MNTSRIDSFKYSRRRDTLRNSKKFLARSSQPTKFVS